MRKLILAAAVALAHAFPAQAQDSAPPSAAEAPAAAETHAPPADGCNGAADLAQLFSPACLEKLRALRAPSGRAATPPAPGAASSTQCAVAIFPGVPKGFEVRTASGTISTFATESLERCIEMATKLSYGIQSLSNIVADSPGYGVVGISCVREAPDGKQIACKPQPDARSRR